MATGFVELAQMAIKLTHAGMTLGDERAHPVRFGERQRLLVVRSGAFGIEVVGMHCDIAEQAVCIGREPGLMPTGLD